MLYVGLFAHSLSAEPGAVALKAVPAETSADVLRTFLADEALLWGCMAMALIALVTVARVASRRRKAGKINAKMRAQSQAVHSFLSSLRAQTGAAERGVWHYDFATGAQQFSDGFKALMGGQPTDDKAIDDALKACGLDLVRLARDHFEQAEPFEVEFALKTPDQGPRAMLLQACNLRNGEGEVQRMVVLITEADTRMQ